jgi:hypothetical protein
MAEPCQKEVLEMTRDKFSPASDELEHSFVSLLRDVPV